MARTLSFVSRLDPASKDLSVLASAVAILHLSDREGMFVCFLLSPMISLRCVKVASVMQKAIQMFDALLRQCWGCVVVDPYYRSVAARRKSIVESGVVVKSSEWCNTLSASELHLCVLSVNAVQNTAFRCMDSPNSARERSVCIRAAALQVLRRSVCFGLTATTTPNPFPSRKQPSPSHCIRKCNAESKSAV